MYLGKVIGNVVASRKAADMEGLRLMVVQPLGHDGNPKGNIVVAADAVNSGPGDTVHLVSSREAALAFKVSFIPVDAAIVGIVDSVDVEARP